MYFDRYYPAAVLPRSVCSACVGGMCRDSTHGVSRLFFASAVLGRGRERPF